VRYRRRDYAISTITIESSEILASRSACEYRQVVMRGTSEGVANAWSSRNPLPREPPFSFEVPGTFHYSWVVMPPHIRPAQRWQPAKVLRAYKCPSGFVQPVHIPAGQLKIHADRGRVMKSKRAW